MADKKSTDSKSVTVRIPTSLLTQIDTKITPKDNRSRIIITLLEKALELPEEPTVSYNSEITDLKTQIDSLQKLLDTLCTDEITPLKIRFENLCDEQDIVTKRLTKVEQDVYEDGVRQSKTNTDKELQKESAEVSTPSTSDAVRQEVTEAAEAPQNGWTDIDSFTEADEVRQSKTIQIDQKELPMANLSGSAGDTLLPEGAALMTSRQLLDILKFEQPEANWTIPKLRKYRMSKKHLGKWYTFGNIKFTYFDGKIPSENEINVQTKQHLWSVIQLANNGI